MSFGKAKRFNYTEPDIVVSPADYNVFSTYYGGYSIPRCPRFKCIQDNPDSPTSSCRCLKSHHRFERLHSSTPNSESTYKNPIKALIDRYNKEDIQNATFHKVPISEAGSSKENVSPLKMKCGSDPGSEGFIDDDYSSYASSEELDTLAKMEQDEFNVVCKEFQKILDRKIFKSTKRDTDFETLVLAKLHSIENEMKVFKENVGELNKNVRQTTHAGIQLSHLKDAQNYFGSKVSLVPKNKQSEVRNVIRAAIQRICYDLHNKKKRMVEQSKAKIAELLQQMDQGHIDADVHVEQLYVEVSKDLTKRVNDVLNNGSDVTGDQEDSFNYENNCGRLQVSKTENGNLEMENMEMTITLKNTKETLDSQTSLINMMYNELDELKDVLKKN